MALVWFTLCPPPQTGWVSPAEAACAAQVHKPAVWLHKCVSDHAAVHRAPLVAVLLNSIFQVVSVPVLTLPGDAAPSQPSARDRGSPACAGNPGCSPSCPWPSVVGAGASPCAGESAAHSGHTRSEGGGCEAGLLGPEVRPAPEAAAVCPSGSRRLVVTIFCCASSL